MSTLLHMSAPMHEGEDDAHSRAADNDAWLHAQVEAACARACQAIAPAWPLDRSIAVNPHWSRVAMPVRRVAARMAVLGGIQVFPPHDLVRQAWDTGRVCDKDLDQALTRLPQARAAGWTAQGCVAALGRSALPTQLPLLIDVLDNGPRREARLPWRQAITHQVSQTCAAYFDDQQADWRPEPAEGLYAFWREALRHDLGIGLLMGIPDLGRGLDALPGTRQDAERWALKRLGLPEAVWADYLEAVLLTVSGWASWCAYLGWQAQQSDRSCEHLRDLLAIRLAWGAVLLECTGGVSADKAFMQLQRAWRDAEHRLMLAESELVVDEVWQTALEIGYQRSLAQQLQKTGGHPPLAVDVQAVFCIDVRSEPIRRALEAVCPSVQTMGFAGFFGLPVAYTPLGSSARRPQLPGLLAPAMTVQDVVRPAGRASEEQEQALHQAAVKARRSTLGLAEQWRTANRWPGAAFSFVEAVGVAYLFKLGRWLQPAAQERPRDDLNGLPARYRPVCRPQLVGLDPEAQVSLAARILHAMGLEQDFAPLVLLVGHGSQSANNAHAAALDCGACCGQTGEVNARSLAQLLNASDVRAGLCSRGVLIPETTWFVATLHNTSTDEIEGFDLDLMPEVARKRWVRLTPLLKQAGEQVRRERAPSLGLNPKRPDKDLLTQLRRRASDGAQTRPEWGLAGNAAFIIAPRQRSLGANFQGRVFLHDYDHRQDGDGRVLELLMTAPMLVTHWINWQYHTSTCDPERLGSGNKLLHNVVAGCLGVFEGNGGDLRIGLARQSLHDGQRWMHEPLRLSVVIEAPRQAIESVLARHAVVRQLVDNGWLHLFCLELSGLRRYADGQWHCDR